MKTIPVPEEKYEKISKLSGVLAHPVRLMILDVLRQSKELSVEDMRHAFDLPKANVSRHLAELRRAGFVKARRDGRNKIYALGHPNVDIFCQTLHDLCSAL